MIGIFAPLAWSDISKEVARNLTFVGVGLVGFGLLMAIWRYFKNPVEKKLRIYNIITVLDKMYRRLEILTNKEKHTGIEWNRYRETADKINKFAGVTIPIVSSVDEARDKVEIAEKEIPSTLFKDKNREQKIIWIQSASRLLDKAGFGLKEKRERDRQYTRLSKMVDEYYNDYKDIIDDELRILIRSCIAFTESAANALLFMRRANIAMDLALQAGIPNVLTPSMEADMEGFDNDIREIARKFRVEIGQYIKKLVRCNGK
jgi:hypothetical protein